MNNSKKLKTIDIAYIGLSVALLTICAWICVPIGVVPITLQVLGVCVVSGLFGTKRAVLSIVSYLALGAVGVPVFSQFKGGIGFLSGATGGYVIGFILTAIVIGAVVKKCGNQAVFLAFGMVLGVLVCYCFGGLWYVAFLNSSVKTIGAVLASCVLPFILPDLAKIALSVLLVNKLKKFVK